MVWAVFIPGHVRNVCTSFDTVNAPTRVAPPRFSLGNTGTVPGLAGLRFGGIRSVLLEAHQHFDFSRYTPPARSNSIRLPVNSLRIGPPVLRNVMILPLSRTCPTAIIDLCNPAI